MVDILAHCMTDASQQDGLEFDSISHLPFQIVLLYSKPVFKLLYSSYNIQYE